MQKVEPQQKHKHKVQLVAGQLESTLALRTPRYNGHPDKTDSS